MKCVTCQTEKGANGRLPRGWHRNSAEYPHCDKCWKSAYVLRADSGRAPGARMGIA